MSDAPDDEIYVPPITPDEAKWIVDHANPAYDGYWKLGRPGMDEAEVTSMVAGKKYKVTTELKSIVSLWYSIVVGGQRAEPLRQGQKLTQKPGTC